MFSITCPVTGTVVLVSAAQIRAVTNSPDFIGLTVACPCGRTHVHRTGRRWEQSRRQAPELVAA